MSVLDYDVKTIDGDMVNLTQYTGKVLLIVNTASKCGFTPQYEGLEELYRKYKDKGFEILGFPCNQFKSQEPGDTKEIKEFCRLTYGVSFPMFAKIEVNGDNTDPFYQELKKTAPGVLGTKAIKWNFTKFLISRDGEKVTRYAPATTPESLEEDIIALIEE